MNIQLNNFGPIKRFDFDLSKNLTILYGKNNIGKSYAISAIYLILKAFKSEELSGEQIEAALFYYRRNKEEIFFSSSEIIKSVIALEESVNKTLIKSTEIETNSGLEKIFKKIISDTILNNLEKSFSNSFPPLDSLKNKLSTDKLSIIVQFKSLEFTISVLRNKLVVSNLTFSENIIIKKITRSKKPEKIGGNYIFYYNSSKKNKVQIVDSIFLEYFTSFNSEIRGVLNNIYFLPASRSGLYHALSAFNAVIAELSKSRAFLSSKIELPNISEPLLDYFLYLANVNTTRVSKKFSTIVDLFESNILKGSVAFNQDTKKLLFVQKNIDSELDLSYTSSMISEIAPIVAYFKYVISDVRSRRRFSIERESKETPAPNMIFIEEPEAHLHPEVQVLLMEIFCEIVKYDIKIVMTSHSNYMLQKLSNLVLDGAISHEKIGSYLMKMEEQGSITDTIAMKADAEGVMDNNFADTSEKLYNERIEIYDKLNSNATKLA